MTHTTYLFSLHPILNFNSVGSSMDSRQCTLERKYALLILIFYHIPHSWALEFKDHILIVKPEKGDK